VIADIHLVGRVAGSQTKDKLEIPNADANLDAIGIGLAEILSLGEIDLGLRIRTHDSTRLLRLAQAALESNGTRTYPMRYAFRIMPPLPSLFCLHATRTLL
jgi:hypothetical protein